MMSRQDKRIFQTFTARVRKRLPDARMWAFGSRVRGNATWESDFDICIVLDQLDQKTDKWLREVAWEVGFENECVITTIVLDADQFENGPMSESTLVANIMREGIAA
jgi:predicted nucleotidyltransferase